MRREVLVCLALYACKSHERAAHHDAARKAVVQPANPDAVRRARDTFTLVPTIDRRGTCGLFLREELMPTPPATDIGDFIGRLRTLFGPTANNEYALRDASGLVIIAAVNPSGPGYYGNRDGDFVARHARIMADPLLAHGPPKDMAQMPAFILRDEIALSGPALTERVYQLDALINSVPPADWEITDYFSSKGGVFHVGAAHGRSFEEQLPPARSLRFLLDAADRAGAGSNAEFTALNYYVAEPKQFEAERPRVLAAYHRFIAAKPDAAGSANDIVWRRALQLDHF